MKVLVLALIICFAPPGFAWALGERAPEATSSRAATTTPNSGKIESKGKFRLAGKLVEFELTKVSASRWVATYRASKTVSASRLSEYFSIHQIAHCRGEGPAQVELERVRWDPPILEMRGKEDKFVKLLETQWSCAQRGRSPAAEETQASMVEALCSRTEEAATKKVCARLGGK